MECSISDEHTRLVVDAEPDREKTENDDGTDLDVAGSPNIHITHQKNEYRISKARATETPNKPKFLRSDFPEVQRAAVCALSSTEKLGLFPLALEELESLKEGKGTWNHSQNFPW